MFPIAVLYALLVGSMLYPPLLLVAVALTVAYGRHLRRRYRQTQADHAQAVGRQRAAEVAKAERLRAAEIAEAIRVFT